MKLWDKDIETDKLIEKFTIGKDRELDLRLARYDVIGSMAHIRMLEHIDLITSEELRALNGELLKILNRIESNEFIIEEGIEDVHSQVEHLLTQSLGDTGRKIHSARSRNDQVLVDIKLFIRDEIHQIVEKAEKLFSILISLSNKYRNILIPGYTHLQIAMPSSFGLWFGAYAEAITDDMLMLLAAYNMANQNPLGSAAGYGSSFPINRKMTTDLLGFNTLHFNVINAQMSRGKTERIVAFALAGLGGTLAKMAGDVCLFNSQNFGFLTLPDNLTTGSSIMPHKKNPDVFELLRAKCNKIQALPYEIDHIWTNLPSGYFRDMQIIKESFLPVFDEMKDCLDIAAYAMEKITPIKDILKDPKYKYLFSVEEVNKLVLSGIPFREAYKQVAIQIKEGTYRPSDIAEHIHEGSIGNLCNKEIELKMREILKDFHFILKDEAIRKLLK